MYELLGLAGAFAVLILLLRFRLSMGRTMLVTALCLMAFLRVSPAALGRTLVWEFRTLPLDETTPHLVLALCAIVTFVNVLGLLIDESGLTGRIGAALQNVFRSRRTALLAVPLIMGMLPTPGGIMLSAPMLKEMGDRMGIGRPRTAAINFFFRHQWEPVWPLFPSVPLIQAMLRVAPAALLAHNIFLTLAGMSAGLVWLLLLGFPPRARGEGAASRAMRQDLLTFFHVAWPIVFAGVFYVAIGLHPALGIFGASLLFAVWHRIAPGRWLPLLRASMKWDFLLLIFAALLFKMILQTAQAVGAITAFLQEVRCPPLLIVFLLPFIVTVLTGVTSASVAVTFPLLAVYIGSGASARLGYEALAFSGVLAGLFVSPVHLCLSMSVSYFETTLWRIVRLMLIPTAAIVAAGAVLALMEPNPRDLPTRRNSSSENAPPAP